MDGMLRALSERLDRLEGRFTQKDLDKKIEEVVGKKVQEYMEEAEEKDKRKLNIIVSNLPESSKETLEERREEDRTRVGELVERISDVPKEDIVNPVRLGQVQVGSKARPRLLRLEVKTEEAKKNIMRNVSKLNTGMTEAKDRIYINNDNTPRERERIKELKQELKTRTDSGETDLMIDYRGFRIVKRSDRRPRTDLNAAKVVAGQDAAEKN